MPETPADTALRRAKRDALGQTCFLVHIAVMLFIVAGWALPWRGALILYLVFVPAVALQWQCNSNACVLNNLEALIRTGRWRDSTNPEEGAWLLTLARNALGLDLRPRHMDGLVYLAMAALWGLALVHFLRS